ncbi:MAG: amidohydrolase [Alphaproteobacteria bacterium]|nr:amidohydrolase [Alphaproteobacteria bacterium]
MTSKMTPDMIIVNGKGITFDDTQPHATALAIKDGIIISVGETADIRALADTSTRVIDAAQNTILPGFIDSHVHLFGGSAELDYLDLYGVKGIDSLTEKVRAWQQTCPDDPIVFAIQADYNIIASGKQTTRQDLDKVLPDRPFAMFAADHHTIWANTKALEMAGILNGGEVDKGAEIVMAADGKAAGELREPGAYAPVLKLTRYGGRDMIGLVTGRNPDPAATMQERQLDADAIARGFKHCASHGITGLHNMDGNIYTLELLKELEQRGDLLCRTEVPFHFKSFDTLDRFAEAETMRRDFSGDWVWCNRVKMFVDGVVESSTALMLDKYPNHDTVGDAVFDEALFKEACVKADAMGLQISVHAIGDRAIRQTLDAYELAQNKNGKRDSRHRIEHIEVLHPDDLPRFSELGVVASIQPGHAPFGVYFSPETVERMLHPHQIPTAYAWQDIRNTGTKVIFSTDWPVIPVDVMPNIKSAVSPQQMPAPWRDQRQSLMDTLESYTAGNAWVEFNENKKGRLKAGMMADIVVMSHDLTAMEPENLDQARAQTTICGGKITYQA